MHRCTRPIACKCHRIRAFLRNVSNMSDNVRYRYVGIRERIGNRSSRGQRDAPKTNVPIIPGGIVRDSNSVFARRPYSKTHHHRRLKLALLARTIDDRIARAIDRMRDDAFTFGRQSAPNRFVIDTNLRDSCESRDKLGRVDEAALKIRREEAALTSPTLRNIDGLFFSRRGKLTARRYFSLGPYLLGFSPRELEGFPGCQNEPACTCQRDILFTRRRRRER